MDLTEETLLKLTKQLYPTGRAWNIPKGSVIEKLHIAINKVQLEAVEGMVGLLDKILADNDNFTEQDAANWERRLQLLTDVATPLAERNLAINRKYAGNKLGGHYLVLQGQLRKAGFDVYVHENNPDNDAPTDFPFYSGATTIQLDQIQLNQSGLNRSSVDIVANFIDENIDRQFSLGSDLRHALFVGGQVKGEPANVPASRKNEFRQLLLTLKYTNTVVILFINFV